MNAINEIVTAGDNRQVTRSSLPLSLPTRALTRRPGGLSLTKSTTKDDERKARREEWQWVFLTAYTALGRIPLDLRTQGGRDQLALLIDTFDEVCAEVPTGRLRECYRRSMRLLDARGQPLFWDARAVFAAWRQLKAELEAAPPAIPLPAACPNAANHVADEDTARVEYHNMAIGEAYRMPCPDCRPEGFRQAAAARLAKQWEADSAPPHPLRVVEKVYARQGADNFAADEKRRAEAEPLRCNLCGLRGELITTAFGLEIGQVCGARSEDAEPCAGILEVAGSVEV